ncbi:Zn-ribbon domain-containing OB-fold protein [Candidatus Harpocratesius sp.]
MSTTPMITVQQYFEYLREKKIMGAKCPKCGNIDLPPRRLCSKCLAESEWMEFSGKGIIQTFTAIYVGAKVMTKKGYDRKHPYVFAVVKMEEGPSISGQLVGIDESDPSTYHIGMLVEATFLKTEIGTDKEGNPVFRWDIGFQPASA